MDHFYIYQKNLDAKVYGLEINNYLRNILIKR